MTAAKSLSMFLSLPGRSPGRLGAIRVHGHLLEAVDLPSLPRRYAVGVLVFGEACLAQSLREGLVALAVEDRERESHVEIERADMAVLPRTNLALIGEERGHEPADDHGLVDEVPELRGDVEASGADVRDLIGGIPRGPVRLHCHHAVQVRSCLRSSVAASSARSGCALRSR